MWNSFLYFRANLCYKFCKFTVPEIEGEGFMELIILLFPTDAFTVAPPYS